MVEAVRVGDGGARQGVGKLGRMGRPMVIPNKSGWYGVAGASVVAAAVTARYVAKWRVRRSMRRGKGDRGLGGGRCFIGLDLSDPTAENKRPCDYAVLDSDLVCTFGQWEYREDAARIIGAARVSSTVSQPTGLCLEAMTGCWLSGSNAQPGG